MEPIQFYKLEASANDFIVVDNRKRLIHDLKSFAQKVCPAHTGVGADGVLAIEPAIQQGADFFLRIVNSDGSEAEACGNGYRCVGLFAHEILNYPKIMSFETLAGMIQAEVKKDSVKVKMSEPIDYHKNMELVLNGRSLQVDFMNTGVPHVVIYSDNVDHMPVYELGRTVRNHEKFQPKGTNVNFVQLVTNSKLKIRTYERGVEDETLACGTGSVAAAICASLSGRIQSPVEVEPKSGETLKIYFEPNGKTAKNVYLEGPAHFVFEGKLKWN